MRLLIVLLSFSTQAGFIDLPQSEFYRYKGPHKKAGNNAGIAPKARKKAKARSKGQDNRALQELLEQDRQILNLLDASSKQLVIKRSQAKIMALTRVRGTLLNSVVAMNTTPATFIVRIDGDREELKGAELKCQGHTFQKRIISQCALMVAEDREYPVSVEIWDLDGAQGIIADYVYSGEEKSFLTSSLATFLQGGLNAARERVMTPFGEVSPQNARNQVVSGLSNIAQNAREKIAQSGDGKLEIAYVNSGKVVLVFFHQSLHLSEEVSK